MGRCPPQTLLGELIALSEATSLMFVAESKHLLAYYRSWQNASGVLEFFVTRRVGALLFLA